MSETAENLTLKIERPSALFRDPVLEMGPHFDEYPQEDQQRYGQALQREQEWEAQGIIHPYPDVREIEVETYIASYTPNPEGRSLEEVISQRVRQAFEKWVELELTAKEENLIKDELDHVEIAALYLGGLEIEKCLERELDEREKKCLKIFERALMDTLIKVDRVRKGRKKPNEECEGIDEKKLIFLFLSTTIWTLVFLDLR